MRRVAGLLAVLAVALAAAAAVPGAAGGAPAPAAKEQVHQAAAGEQRAMKVLTRKQWLNRLRATDRQFHRLQARVRPCALARATLVGVYRLHAVALRGAARATRASLQKRNSRLRTAVIRLSRVARRCAVAARPPSPPVSAPDPVPVSNQPITTSPARTLRVPISLATVVNGQALDVSEALGSLALPASLPLRDLSELGSSACTRRGAVCLGVDRSLLSSKLGELMNKNLLVLLLRNVGSLNIGGVLTQITRLIIGNDLSQLIQVQRLGDRTLRLVPIGPLQEVTGLPDIPAAEVAQLQVVR